MTPLRNVFFCLLMFSAGMLGAQDFSLTVLSPDLAKGGCALTIYQPDGTAAQIKATFRHGAASFAGPISQPAPAVFTHSGWDKEILFWIEPAEIVVKLDTEEPRRSPISGSRTNSQYRIVLEDCASGSQNESLQNFIVQNPASIFSPLLLFQNLAEWEFSLCQKLFGRLDGDARNTYHYKALQKQLPLMQQALPGSPLPRFRYLDQGKRTVDIDSVTHPDSLMLLVFTASWCKPLESSIPAVSILLDHQPKQWDSDPFQQLAVPYIPYLVLIDSSNTILECGFPQWQLPRLLKNCHKRQRSASAQQYN